MLEGVLAVHIFPLLFLVELARLSLLPEVLTLSTKHPENLYCCQCAERRIKMEIIGCFVLCKESSSMHMESMCCKHTEAGSILFM